MSKGPFTSSGPRPHDNWTISGARDARTGLGYGILEPKTQFPRQMSGEFPYGEIEDSASDEYDEESAMAVSKKYDNYEPTDFLRAAGTQHFYFAAGNTKLSDCFWNTGKVINEIAAFSDSMVSIAGLYKGMGPALGNSGASFPYQGGGGTNYKRTGSLRGWSKTPPENSIEAEMSAEIDKKEEIFTLKDLADKILSQNGESLK
jgi:hypothetical protein